jgi:GR25 family glycosyltransferase involved in LPS biosynthesis
VDLEGTEKMHTTRSSDSRLLIQVINLVRRPDRLIQISAELERAGLNFEIQVAIDGKLENSQSEFLSGGQIGCWKSHLNSMRRLSETNSQFSLIIEDDAVFGPEVNQKYLIEMLDLMERNQLDILQIGFIDHLYTVSIRPGILEFLIALLKGRGTKDSSGTRIVLGDFRWGTHAYIINQRFAKSIVDVVSEPPLIPFDAWLGLMAQSQTDRKMRIARLAKSVVSQASHSSKESIIDSDVVN